MIPEKVFHQILALGEGWRVSRVEYVEKESKVTIGIEETPGLWPTQSCPHCGRQPVSGYDHAPERRWRASERLPLAVGGGVRAAPRTMSALPESVYGAGAVGRPQPRADAGV